MKEMKEIERESDNLRAPFGFPVQRLSAQEEHGGDEDDRQEAQRDFNVADGREAGGRCWRHNRLALRRRSLGDEGDGLEGRGQGRAGSNRSAAAGISSATAALSIGRGEGCRGLERGCGGGS